MIILFLKHVLGFPEGQVRLERFIAMHDLNESKETQNVEGERSISDTPLKPYTLSTNK